jgi:CHAT domain
LAKHTILFLAANPLGTDRLALDEEARAIQEELERSHRDQFELVTRWAVRPLDLLRELRRLKPLIVHFSGHGIQSTTRTSRPVGELDRDVVEDWGAVYGEAQRGLFFQGPDGRPRLVSTTALEQTFGAIGTSVKLVVLNACYSERQAEALVAHVGCVVGMGGCVSDDAARNFAIGFYGGLCDQESVAESYQQGRAAIALGGLPDQERPQLRVRTGVDASDLVLATSGSLPGHDEGSPRPERSGRRRDRAVRRGIAILALTLLTGLAILPAFREDDEIVRSRNIVENLGSKITRVWGEFEFLATKDSEVPLDSGNHAASRIGEQAIQLANNLLAIDDFQLDFTTLVLKWQYVAYGYVISASVERDPVMRNWLSRRASWAADYALYAIEEVRSRAFHGKLEYLPVLEFLEKDLASGRMQYLIALSLAIRHRSSDPTVTLQDVLDAISKVSGYYKLNFPLTWNPWLRGFVVSQKEVDNAEH